MPDSNLSQRWYLILGRDAEGAGPARAMARPAHLARLQALAEAGRLKVAGPLPRKDGVPPAEGGVSGSLIVAAFDDLAAAQAWAADDPYVAARVYAHVDVQPFLPVLP
ncbi:YciI family protein [Silanimonas algicola]